MTTVPESAIGNPKSAIQKLSLFAADIKLSHTVFALPWALFATFLAAHGLPRTHQLLLILGCMVAARTFAMAANRLLDARLDAVNPRTARRALPAGRLTRAFYAGVLFLTGSAFCLLTSAFYFLDRNAYPVALSLPVLAFLAGYPLLKRFTRLCHYYLGAALALAPVCAWLAIAGTLALPPFVMFAAVLTWTAGFDILYACQDYESDRATGVFSVPARVGIPAALRIARATHTLSAAAIVSLGFIAPPLGPLYFTGAACALLLLVTEHALVSPTDLSKVNLAFFTINGIISVLLGTLGILDIFF